MMGFRMSDKTATRGSVRNYGGQHTFGVEDGSFRGRLDIVVERMQSKSEQGLVL